MTPKKCISTSEDQNPFPKRTEFHKERQNKVRRTEEAKGVHQNIHT